MLLPRYSDITHGLTQRPARISPKYFYDQHGSQLFEAITRLPEYYPTRTEMALMQAHADSIAHAIGPGRTLIELGAGNCQKARTLCRLVQPACFVGVDISADFLEQAVQGLRDEFPALDARALAGDMTLGVSLPDDIPRTGRLVFYPGSSIGNFDPPQAVALLAQEAASQATVMAYNDAYFLTAMVALAALAAHAPDRRIAVCKELTKLHERVFRGTLAQAAEAAPTMVISPPPVKDAAANARIGQLAALQQQLCAKRGIAFAQVYDFLADANDYMNDLSDGLHPGSQGCDRMAQTLLAQECVRAFMCAAQ